jgi:hypothetical protein
MSAAERARAGRPCDVLGMLIDTVVPMRVRHGEYELKVSWSPLGSALRLALTEIGVAA